MAEPEEESDEEWRRIAEVVGIFEQQVARARTAQGAGSSAPQPVEQPLQAQVQASPQQEVQQVQIRGSPPQGVQQAQVPLQPPERRVNNGQFQAQPKSRKRVRIASPSPPGPSSHLAALSSAPALTAAASQQRQDQIEELNAAVANLRTENTRLKTEYTTRIRHLEARISQTQEASTLRSRVNLLERELREARRGGVQATQAGEVVEATQTGLDVLKASIKPRRERVKESVIFGGWGVDRRFGDELIRGKLFDEIGEALVRFGCCVREAVEGDWPGVVQGLVGLLDGEGWRVGIRGLGVVLLYSKTGREVMVDCDIVRKVLKCLRCGEVYKVVESIVMGCVEVGILGDEVRKIVVMDDELMKLFRNGDYGAGRVMAACVVTALECEDGRVGDDEWGRVEMIVNESVRLVGVTSVGESCLDILVCCAVLAGDVLLRVGGVEALLNVVMDGVLGGEEKRMRKALMAIKEVVDGCYQFNIRSNVKTVALPFLFELVRRDGVVGVASYVTAAIINNKNNE